MTQYKSISCSTYDFLELAALKKKTVSIRIQEGDQTFSLVVRVLDVFSKGKEEFLRCVVAETETEQIFRLDSIKEIHDLDTLRQYPTNVC